MIRPKKSELGGRVGSEFDRLWKAIKQNQLIANKDQKISRTTQGTIIEEGATKVERSEWGQPPDQIIYAGAIWSASYSPMLDTRFPFYFCSLISIGGECDSQYLTVNGLRDSHTDWPSLANPWSNRDYQFRNWGLPVLKPPMSPEQVEALGIDLGACDEVPGGFLPRDDMMLKPCPVMGCSHDDEVWFRGNEDFYRPTIYPSRPHTEPGLWIMPLKEVVELEYNAGQTAYTTWLETGSSKPFIDVSHGYGNTPNIPAKMRIEHVVIQGPAFGNWVKGGIPAHAI